MRSKGKKGKTAKSHKKKVSTTTRKSKPRLTNEKKIALINLFRAQTSGESQNNFCARYDVNSSAFSKWTKNYDKLLRAAPNGKIGGRKCRHDREKARIRAWASKEVSAGRQVDVHAVLNVAEKKAASLFSRTSSANSRYVKCFRLLRDIGPQLQLREIDMVTSSLLELSEERHSSVQRPSTYFHQEYHTFVECSVEDFTMVFDEKCVCTGMCHVVSLGRTNSYFLDEQTELMLCVCQVCVMQRV